MKTYQIAAKHESHLPMLVRNHLGVFGSRREAADKISELKTNHNPTQYCVVETDDTIRYLLVDL